MIKPGPPAVLELVNDYPVPELRDGEVTLLYHKELLIYSVCIHISECMHMAVYCRVAKAPSHTGATDMTFATCGQRSRVCLITRRF